MGVPQILMRMRRALEQLPMRPCTNCATVWEFGEPKKFVNSQGIERESKAIAWVERIEE